MRAASVIILSVILIQIHFSSSARPAHRLSREMLGVQKRIRDGGGANNVPVQKAANNVPVERAANNVPVERAANNVPVERGGVTNVPVQKDGQGQKRIEAKDVDLSDERWSYFMNPYRRIIYNKTGHVTHGFDPDDEVMGVGYNGKDLVMICAKEVRITYGDYYALNNYDLPSKQSQKKLVACIMERNSKSNYFNEDLMPGKKLRAALGLTIIPGAISILKSIVDKGLTEYFHPGDQKIYEGFNTDCIHSDLLEILIYGLKTYEKGTDHAETAFNLMEKIMTHKKWSNLKTLIFRLRVKRLDWEKENGQYNEVKEIKDSTE